MFTDILWDFDGTLFDTYPGIVDSMLRALRDEGIEEAFDDVMLKMRESVSDAIDHFREKYRLAKSFDDSFDRYHRQIVRENVKLFPHVADVIRAVDGSGRRNYLYTHRGYSAMEYLEMHGLIDCFQDCITREDDFPMKPNPEAILYLIGKHKLDRTKTLMVGDREIDMLAARNAGIMPCFFDPGAKMDSPNADYRIRSMAELAPIIGIEL